MIQVEYGRDMFDSPANVLVNPVNTVGVMGKGLAYIFKLRFPNNYIAYKDACSTGECAVGKCFVYEENGFTIINFPTKHHWMDDSKMDFVEQGLTDMIQHIKPNDVVALPALGCGLGKLDVEEVSDLIIKKLLPVPKVTFLLFL